MHFYVQTYTQQSTGGLIGSTTTPATGNTSTTGSSLFSSTATATTSSGTSLFGSKPAEGRNLVGSTQPPASAKPTGNNLFGTTQQPTSSTSSAGLGGILKQEKSGVSEQMGGDSLVREIPS
uniref:Uncharacterized protein n=1 Tax=Panagrolaimus sp. ES5 TaxID=591445 RepID=A0AC34GBB3_9BILA